MFADYRLQIYQQEDVAPRRVGVGAGTDRLSQGPGDAILQVPRALCWDTSGSHRQKNLTSEFFSSGIFHFISFVVFSLLFFRSLILELVELWS